MAGRYSARRIDGDQGRYDRRFREMQRGQNGLLQAVPGSTVSIQQIMTDPAGAVQYIDTDATTAVADDATVTFPLTYIPIAGSLWVRQNGVVLEADEFTRAGKIITIPASSGMVIRAGDVFSAWYVRDATSAPVAVTYRDTAPQQLNGWSIPTGSVRTDLLIAIAMMPSTESMASLNGWSPVGTSAYVTHAAHGAGTRTYRLEIYSFNNDGLGTVPTCTNGSAEDVVCSMVAFANGSLVQAVFDTQNSGTSASAPADDPVALRVWGTIGDTITITPSRGVMVLNTNYVEIDTVLTVDNDPTAAPATATGDAGWCLASLTVY